MEAAALASLAIQQNPREREKEAAEKEAAAATAAALASLALQQNPREGEKDLAEKLVGERKGG
jgi:hypothetical protein